MSDALALNRFEWLKAVTQADLPAQAKVVATALAVQFANDESRQINPSMTTLAEYVKTSVDTIKRAIRALVEGGWLARTEGRGAGNSTLYKLLSPGKIIRFAAVRRAANRGEKKGANLHLQVQKKGANLRGKGGKSAPSYKDEQSYEQKARASGYRPSPHLRRCIHPGTHREIAWDEWLLSRGFPSLAKLGQRSSDANGTGWDAPFSVPPKLDDPLGTGIAEKWAFWAWSRMEGRCYAAE